MHATSASACSETHARVAARASTSGSRSRARATPARLPRRGVGITTTTSSPSASLDATTTRAPRRREAASSARSRGVSVVARASSSARSRGVSVVARASSSMGGGAARDDSDARDLPRTSQQQNPAAEYDLESMKPKRPPKAASDMPPPPPPEPSMASSRTKNGIAAAGGGAGRKKTNDTGVPPPAKPAEQKSHPLHANAANATKKKKSKPGNGNASDPIVTPAGTEKIDGAPGGKAVKASESDDARNNVVAPSPYKKEDEKFALDKKRMELIIEEKEWDLAEMEHGEEKMDKIIEYVHAVEQYKKLCAAKVPDTVSDLLSQYVRVYCLAPGATGYEEALDFLCLGEGESEDEIDMNAYDDDRRVRNCGVMDLSEVERVIRMLGGEEAAEDSDDDDDDDDDETGGNSFKGFSGSPYKPDNKLHIAQDVDGDWRWLEDDLGRALPARPNGDYSVRMMSVEEMVHLGLNVNSLHEEVDPAELVDFSSCKSWDDAIRVGREVESALEHMRADGWEVDTRAWCSEAEPLVVVKNLTPLRTMSHVDGQKKKKTTPRGKKKGRKGPTAAA